MDTTDRSADRERDALTEFRQSLRADRLPVTGQPPKVQGKQKVLRTALGGGRPKFFKGLQCTAVYVNMAAYRPIVTSSGR